MPSVERGTFTVPIPGHASRTSPDKQGRVFAVWVDRKGRSVRAEVSADGTRCTRTTVEWYAVYHDQFGKRRKKKGFKDRGATMKLALELQDKADRIRAGITTPDSTAGNEHLIDHVPGYVAKLTESGRAKRHVQYTESILKTILNGVPITTAANVDADEITRWIERERQTKRDDNPLSLRTRNRWVQCLRSFGRWLEVDGIVPVNPFRRLESVNAQTDPRRTRRALSAEEFRRFVQAARSGPVLRMLAGEARAVLYLTAAYTGFRAGTLATLTPESFVRAGERILAVYAPAGKTKNRKAHGVPTHPDLAAELQTYLEGKPPGKPVWPGTWAARSSEMVQADLAAAGIPYRDATGAVFDFHSLRVQFGSMLAGAGVPLTVAQKLMDHSSPSLTANIYSRFGGELAESIGKLPGMKHRKEGPGCEPN